MFLVHGRVIYVLFYDEGGAVLAADLLEELHRLGFRPEIADGHLEEGTGEAAVGDDAGVGRFEAALDLLRHLAGVLLVVEEDTDAVAGHRLRAVVGNMGVHRGCDGRGLVHLDHREDRAADEGRIDRRRRPVHEGVDDVEPFGDNQFLRTEACQRQGQDGEENEEYLSFHRTISLIFKFLILTLLPGALGGPTRKVTSAR